ncbi:unnamed protein product [marine sediment metagenome]|uniref:Uncharacterized protein n=1 Tax=marine sediment metagenome TaxID=412755 RepID=X1LI88_9ZZZZ
MREYPWTIKMLDQNRIIRRVKNIRRALEGGWLIDADDSGKDQTFQCRS